MDQFYAKDPLFPPVMFLRSRVFTLTVVGGTMIAFVRGSITYILIFFLQGPYGMNPLQAGELHCIIAETLPNLPYLPFIYNAILRH